MSDDPAVDKMQELLQSLAAKISREGGGTCAHCLRELPARELGALSMFIPDNPGINGKLRISAYAVCAKCMKLPDKSRSQKIEDNLIRSGLFLSPETERLF